MVPLKLFPFVPLTITAKFQESSMILKGGSMSLKFHIVSLIGSCTIFTVTSLQTSIFELYGLKCFKPVQRLPKNTFLHWCSMKWCWFIFCMTSFMVGFHLFWSFIETTLIRYSIQNRCRLGWSNNDKKVEVLGIVQGTPQTGAFCPSDHHCKISGVQHDFKGGLLSFKVNLVSPVGFCMILTLMCLMTSTVKFVATDDSELLFNNYKYIYSIWNHIITV